MQARLRSIRRTLNAALEPAAPELTARRARIALLVCIALVMAMLAWSTWDHIDARLEREHALAAQVTAGIADELTRRLAEMNDRMDAFVDQEQTLIAGIAANPNAPVLNENLWSLIQLVFPDADGAWVTDAQGLRVTALGEWPQDDVAPFLHSFLRGESGALYMGGTGLPRVSIAASVSGDNAAGALLLHMGCNSLCRSLEGAAPLGHSLSVVRTPIAGSARQDAGGTGALLARAPLDDSGWQLQDRLDDHYRMRLILHRSVLGLGLGVAFLLAVFALYRWVQSKNRSALLEHRDLRESRIKLQAILSATTDGILITDPQGLIELFNPAAEVMFGRLAEDVTGMSAERLLPELVSGGFIDSLLSGGNGEHSPPVVREAQAVRRDGKKFPVRLWLSSVHFDQKPHLLTSVEDLTEQERSEQLLVFLEQRDVLTGLLNRKELEHRLRALMSDESVAGPHVLCHMGVDQFKLLNDSCGYEAGDALLKQLAILFDAKVDEASIVARLGGDEFGVLLPQRNIDEAREICEDFVRTVRNFLFTWGDQSFDVAVSIGLIEFQPHNESPSSVLSKADVACHMAKTHGRDRIHTYHDGDAELTRHHDDMRLVSAISRALSDDRFHLYAQPIVPLSSDHGARRHFEVLVRMVDESGTSLVPNHFIPAAERYILMPAVDRWIINRLFSLQADNLRAWNQLVPDGFLFAINLSATSLADEAFLRYLKRQFTDWDVPYPSVCFEITETATIRNLEQARNFMDELSELGCAFALDDFGTGLSNYGYLRELPVDYLKIDGSFVRGMTEDPVNRALVESINQIGHVLGLKTIAEWAEDQTVINQLRELNVDFAQGYGVGEPIAVCDLTLGDTERPQRQNQNDHERHGGTHRPRDKTARQA